MLIVLFYVPWFAVYESEKCYALKFFRQALYNIITSDQLSQFQSMKLLSLNL